MSGIHGGIIGYKVRYNILVSKQLDELVTPSVFSVQRELKNTPQLSLWGFLLIKIDVRVKKSSTQLNTSKRVKVLRVFIIRINNPKHFDIFWGDAIQHTKLSKIQNQL